MKVQMPLDSLQKPLRQDVLLGRRRNQALRPRVARRGRRPLHVPRTPLPGNVLTHRHQGRVLRPGSTVNIRTELAVPGNLVPQGPMSPGDLGVQNRRTVLIDPASRSATYGVPRVVWPCRLTWVQRSRASRGEKATRIPEACSMGTPILEGDGIELLKKPGWLLENI